MDLTLINDIDDEEVIDPDLGIDQETMDQEVSDQQIKRDIFTEGSIFIVIYEEDGEYIDKLLTVKTFNDEQDKLLLKDENENDEFLYYDTDDTLIMKNSFYTIYEIEKVEEFTDSIDELELNMVQELYPEIELEVEEVKEKKYSTKEKKESLITELIAIYKAYGDDTMIYQITEMVDQLMNMYSLEDQSFDGSDTIDFLKRMMNQKQYSIPKWIIPIVDNKKVIYQEKEEREEEAGEESKDTIIRNFDEVVVEKYNLLSSIEDNHYKKFINIIQSYNPYQNYDTVTFPYHGVYLRNCDVPCNGLKGTVSFDMNNTKDELIYPKQDKETVFETLSSKEQLSIQGFYALPHTFLDITLSKKFLSLHELYFLSHFKFSRKLFKNRIQDRILPHIINNETVNEGEDMTEDIHSYILENKDITFDQLKVILKNNLPGYTNLLNSIPKEMKNVIYNFSDLRRAYLSYGIDYFELDKDNREEVNDMIKKNIKRYILDYNSSVKRKVFQKMKKKKTILSTKDKIKLCKDFIMGLYIIPVKNNYLKKFINTFSRNPRIDEDQNYLYEKDSNDKLLCKHHLYEIQSHKDPNAMDTLKSVYGGEVTDGILCCKVCKEYICKEDFSLLEGFGEDGFISTREELQIDKEEINKLTEEQIQIKKRIQKITSLFGVELTKHDKQKIIDYYELFNNEEFINERYTYTSSIKEYPEYKVLESNYTFIKPAKTKKDQIQNKKNKSLLMKDLSILKNYLIDCNSIFIDLFFILFFIQTSIPSYSISSKLSIDLFDFINKDWDDQDFSRNIVMKTVDTIKIILQKMIHLNQKNPFWKNIQKLLIESTTYKQLPPFNQQFVNITNFILKNASIREDLKKYVDFKKTNIKNIYLNEYWVTYKPLFDNKIVQTINQKTNNEMDEMKDFLLKKGPEILHENISSIRPFDDAYNNPRFKQLNIPFSEIMKNESYERLFNYAIHLHGSSPSIPIINLLIQRFIQTITDKNIESMLQELGWSSSFKKVDKVNYNQFRRVFVQSLTEYFKKKNPEDADTINIYIHFHINNWNGILLNGHPKRDYRYIPPTIFPDQSYEELLSVDIKESGDEDIHTEKNFINELFNRYCFDENEEINEKYDVDKFIYNIIGDPQIEKSSVCYQLLPKTKENFYKILDYKRQSTKLPLPTQDISNQTIESRVKHFIKDNHLLKQNADESYIIFRSLYDITNETSQKDYRMLFNDMFKHNSFMINKIQEFFHKNEDLEKDQLDRFRSNFGRTIDSLSVLINRLIESTEKIPGLLTHLFHTLSRVSNVQDTEDGIYFHNNIPKQWKLSETTKKYLQEYLEINEFLMHYDVFIPQKEKKEIGFYQYQTEKNYALCFQGMFNFVKQFYQKDYHTIIQKDNFLEEYSNIFNRFNFLFIFCKMIDYIENLKDDESTVSNEAILLFSSLEEQERINKNDSIRLCTRFTFDILIDLLESFIDPLWVFQSENLSDKLSRQREREKQSIIDAHETTDDRLVMVHHEKLGLSSHFKEAAQKNQTHIQSDTFKQNTIDERSEVAKELFSQNEAELEILESMGIDTSRLHPSIPEEDETQEGNSQFDEDREEEGDDDMDNDGDYKEN